MPRLRWLLVMDSTPSTDGAEFSYRLWLTPLDGAEQPAARFDTVEELYAALLACGEQREGPDEPNPAVTRHS